ncbi:E3 SUMO-protein ligase [Wickerhamomyces ciferrii]|uniref:E3 SUMO-protein ligase n=1 Tax=Wickerhamomyces ciferrii (strain ATCC 14091 / BCRC 22168 / CBS 111 / JCM 3599 / NBRC 0793 / NRRL Y-1031 F-60-10) TaxID=1206466 RepID=K0KIR5_WICCF|nr:E3 SUMO-protein ligase [Wickerhamomyces ciferrii]CCH41279.1 E3 SUMO-protein ligase [Wickerhamomyces ciferrii]
MSQPGAGPITDQEYNNILNYINSLRLSDLKLVARALSVAQAGRKADVSDRIKRYLQIGKESGDVNRVRAIGKIVEIAFRQENVPNYETVYGSLNLMSPRSSQSNSNQQFNTSQDSLPRSQTNPRKPWLFFKENPFFVLKKLVTPNAGVCLKAPNSRGTGHVSFQLSEQDCELLKQSSKFKLFLLCGAYDKNKPSTDTVVEFPQPLEIHFNGVQIKDNVKGLKNKPGTARPANLTPHISPPKHQNSLNMVYAFTKTDYLIFCYLIEEVSPDKILQKILSNPHIVKEKTLKDFQNEGDDDDIQEVSTRLSLKCPLSFTRFKYPAKSIACKHVPCFDALSFIYLQEQASTWTCPVCSIPVKVKDIAIDDYVMEIMKNTSEDVETVEIDLDGSWKPIYEEDEGPNHKKQSQGPGSASPNDHIKQESKNASKAPTPANEPEIISLDSDEDEDEQPTPVSVPTPGPQHRPVPEAQPAPQPAPQSQVPPSTTPNNINNNQAQQQQGAHHNVQQHQHQQQQQPHQQQAPQQHHQGTPSQGPQLQTFQHHVPQQQQHQQPQQQSQLSHQNAQQQHQAPRSQAPQLQTFQHAGPQQPQQQHQQQQVPQQHQVPQHSQQPFRAQVGEAPAQAQHQHQQTQRPAQTVQPAQSTQPGESQLQHQNNITSRVIQAPTGNSTHQNNVVSNNNNNGNQSPNNQSNASRILPQPQSDIQSQQLPPSVQPSAQQRQFDILSHSLPQNQVPLSPQSPSNINSPQQAPVPSTVFRVQSNPQHTQQQHNPLIRKAPPQSPPLQNNAATINNTSLSSPLAHNTETAPAQSTTQSGSPGSSGQASTNNVNSPLNQAPQVNNNAQIQRNGDSSSSAASPLNAQNSPVQTTTSTSPQISAPRQPTRPLDIYEQEMKELEQLKQRIHRAGRTPISRPSPSLPPALPPHQRFDRLSTNPQPDLFRPINPMHTQHAYNQQRGGLRGYFQGPAPSLYGNQEFNYLMNTGPQNQQRVDTQGQSTHQFSVNQTSRATYPLHGAQQQPQQHQQPQVHQQPNQQSQRPQIPSPLNVADGSNGSTVQNQAARKLPDLAPKVNNTQGINQRRVLSNPDHSLGQTAQQSSLKASLDDYQQKHGLNRANTINTPPNYGHPGALQNVQKLRENLNNRPSVSNSNGPVSRPESRVQAQTNESSNQVQNYQSHQTDDLAKKVDSAPISTSQNPSSEPKTQPQQQPQQHSLQSQPQPVQANQPNEQPQPAQSSQPSVQPQQKDQQQQQQSNPQETRKSPQIRSLFVDPDAEKIESSSSATKVNSAPLPSVNIPSWSNNSLLRSNSTAFSPSRFAPPQDQGINSTGNSNPASSNPSNKSSPHVANATPTLSGNPTPTPPPTTSGILGISVDTNSLFKKKADNVINNQSNQISKSRTMPNVFLPSKRPMSGEKRKVSNQSAPENVKRSQQQSPTIQKPSQQLPPVQGTTLNNPSAPQPNIAPNPTSSLAQSHEPKYPQLARVNSTVIDLTSDGEDDDDTPLLKRNNYLNTPVVDDDDIPLLRRNDRPPNRPN